MEKIEDLPKMWEHLSNNNPPKSKVPFNMRYAKVNAWPSEYNPRPKPQRAPTCYDKADDLEEFEDLFPEGTKSLLCKCLTKEIWDEYKDQSDAAGVSFKVCCFSGVKNLDSGIGLYAGSHDSYKCFDKLFD